MYPKPDLEGKDIEVQIGMKSNSNTMEDNHDEAWPDEDWPMNEPGEKSYKITGIVFCRPRDEDKWEEQLNSQPVRVGGHIYGPGEWNDPVMRSLKTTLPPWINRSGNWIPPPSGVGVDLKAVHLAEVKRMEENKGYTLTFLEEVEDIKININTYETQETPGSVPSGVPTGRGRP